MEWVGSSFSSSVAVEYPGRTIGRASVRAKKPRVLSAVAATQVDGAMLPREERERGRAMPVSSSSLARNWSMKNSEMVLQSPSTRLVFMTSQYSPTNFP